MPASPVVSEGDADVQQNHGRDQKMRHIPPGALNTLRALKRPHEKNPDRLDGQGFMQTLVPKVGIEPTRVAPLDFESSASTSFTTPAERFREYSGRRI